jgi:hypothetical protein
MPNNPAAQAVQKPGQKRPLGAVIDGELRGSPSEPEQIGSILMPLLSLIFEGDDLDDEQR